MDELQARHRKEQRDLQSQITQKRKQASKKTRKSVNDECERLTAELQARQRRELDALTGAPSSPSGASPDHVDGDHAPDLSPEQLTALTLQVGDDVDATPPADSDRHAPSTAASTHETPAQGDGHPRKPNRQKARLARRAAEQASLAESAAAEARALPDLKTQERGRMLDAMATRRLREVEIRADGHCLYSAFADQLSSLEIPLTLSSSTSPSTTITPSSPPLSETEGQASSGDAAAAASKPAPAYKVVRGAAAGYIASHGDDFAPFLEEPLDEYVRKVRDTGEWGGQLELLALAATYGLVINVLQDFGRVERIESPHRQGDGAASEDDDEGRKEVWLGYYKHGFGLGEHYNSLRKVGS